MLIFIIEVLSACLLLTAGCLLSTRRLMDNPNLAKLNCPLAIVQRLIEAGLVSGNRPPSEWQRIKKKWPAISLSVCCWDCSCAMQTAARTSFPASVCSSVFPAV